MRMRLATWPFVFPVPVAPVALAAFAAVAVAACDDPPKKGASAKPSAEPASAAPRAAPGAAPSAPTPIKPQAPVI